MKLEDVRLGQIVRIENTNKQINVGDIYGIFLGFNKDIKGTVYKLCTYSSFEDDVKEDAVVLKNLAVELAKVAITKELDINRLFKHTRLNKMSVIGSLSEDAVKVWLTKSSLLNADVKSRLDSLSDLEEIKKKDKKLKQEKEHYIKNSLFMLTKPFDSYERTRIFKSGNVYFTSECRNHMYIYVKDTIFLYFEVEKIDFDMIENSLVLSNVSLYVHVVDINLNKLGYIYDTGCNIFDLSDNKQRLESYFEK